MIRITVKYVQKLYKKDIHHISLIQDQTDNGLVYIENRDKLTGWVIVTKSSPFEFLTNTMSIYLNYFISASIPL